MKLLSLILIIATLFLLEPAAASYYPNDPYAPYPYHHPYALRHRIRDRLRRTKHRLLYGRRPHSHLYHAHHHSTRLVHWNRTDRRLMRISYAIRLFLNYKRMHPYRYHEHQMAYRALSPVLHASHSMYLPPLRHYKHYRRMHRMRYNLMMGHGRRYHRSHKYAYGGMMMHRPRYHHRRYYYGPRYSRKYYWAHY